MTLLELTVILVALLAFVAILSVGARYWIRGSDRTSCILTMRNVQVAARSYQNLYGYSFGGRPEAHRGSQDIAQHLFNKGYIEESTFNQARGAATCAAGGTYTCPLPDRFPEEGQLYMNCSLSESANHVPSDHENW